MPPQAATPPRNASYWVLNLAILHASNDTREAPWYGPWNIVLQDLFRDFCQWANLIYTTTYPQFPLVKDIDVVVDSEGEDSDEDKLKDYHWQPKVGFYGSMALPLPPIKYTC